GPEPASLHVLPTIWFRNIWSWGMNPSRPMLQQIPSSTNKSVVFVSDPELRDRFLYCEGPSELLFTENETNKERLFGSANRVPYVKDGINNYIVHGLNQAVNPEKKGTKASAHYVVTVEPWQSQTLRLRLTDSELAGIISSKNTENGPFGSSYEAVMQARQREADEFYATVISSRLGTDAANV